MTTNPTTDSIDQLPQADQAAIAATLGALLDGFERRDADRLHSVYADDADWVNAFGSVKKGRMEIVEYLRGLFADANFKAGVLVAPPDSAIRRVTDDVALVSTHLQIRGQLLVDGDTIGLRDNHSLRVLARHPDGRWLVESEMYMDARTDESYIHHS